MRANRSQGFALVVALLLMVALSFVGVAALRNVSLQERMAGNAYFRTVATHEAEANLRLARQNIDVVAQSASLNFPAVASSTLPGTWGGLLSDDSRKFWATATSWASTSQPAALNSAKPLDGRWTIEQLPGTNPQCPASAGSFAGAGSNKCPSMFFRSSARAADAVTGASAAVQEWSMYASD